MKCETESVTHAESATQAAASATQAAGSAMRAGAAVTGAAADIAEPELQPKHLLKEVTSTGNRLRARC
jgi:hypothetical protein